MHATSKPLWHIGHPDAEVYAWPDTLLASGAEAIRTRHVERFKEPNLLAILICRVGVGGLVIDRDQTGRRLFNIKETRLLHTVSPFSPLR